MTYNYNIEPDDERYRIIYSCIAICIGTILAVAFALSLSSCSTKSVVTDTERIDSTAIVSKSEADSVAVHTLYRDRLIDHYVNTTYVLSPLGDTLKEKVVDRYVEVSDTKQTDSIATLKQTVDSLSQVKKQKDVQIIEKRLGWWEQIMIDSYPILAVLLIACFTLIISLYRHQNR